jgi:hypothetical protein
MKVEITNPKTIVVTEQQTKTYNELTVKRLVDFPEKKKVVAFIKEVNNPIILWEGAAYDTIGEWTSANVSERLSELYSA